MQWCVSITGFEGLPARPAIWGRTQPGVLKHAV
jgi:hypothetical protein